MAAQHPTPGDRFVDKTVLVIGGGMADRDHTNGSAAAVAYAAQGADVIIADRAGENAENTAARIADAGGRARAVQADATAEADIRSVVDLIVREHGRIDVLHNNVGSTVMGLPPKLDWDRWNAALTLNAGSVFLACKHVLPIMESQRAGAIVNISSIASLRDTGYPYPAYSAAKAAVNQLTVTLALQYAHLGIRVNAVAPGIIDSPLIYREISDHYASVDEMIAARDAMTPRGRMGTPWDVAEASLFLASDAADFINGVVLPVDGGQHMRVG